MIPTHVKIKDDELPPMPGVYFMKDDGGKVMYVGKATSLRTRVGSYFTRPHDARIAAMVSKIAAIDWLQTQTAVEALLLEAKWIKKLMPPYNVMEKDDKSFVYLAFTREAYPHPVLIRGRELARTPRKTFLKTFGPFRSAYAVRASLDAMRRSFPWTDCTPGRKRPCFYRHLGLCPGVCTGEITPAAYRKIIVALMAFFSGDRERVIRSMWRQMEIAAKAQRFEDATALRDRLYALEHVRDMAVLKRDEEATRGDAMIDIYGRIEGYDISNISGTDAVGSLVVFRDGEARKKDYRTFRIKLVEGPNDFAMLEEVLTRRFAYPPSDEWPAPDVVLIDGGVGQVNVAKRVLGKYGLQYPVVGLAKGPDRKRDELVYDSTDHELARLAHAFRPMLQRVRDEAHRFAVAYHRRLRGKRMKAQ